MGLLHALQLAAFILAVSAVLWAVALILLKRIRAAGEAKRKLAQKAAINLLMDGLSGDAGAAGDLLKQPRLLAETLLDFMGLVRGEDGERLIKELRKVGVEKVLLRHASKGSRSAQLACVEALIAFPGEGSRKVLIHALRHSSVQIRMLAARALVESGEELGLKTLLDLISGGTLPHSQRVGVLLEILTKRDIEETITALCRDDLSPQIKVLLINALGRSGDYAALPALLVASFDEDPDVRACAVGALGMLKHPSCEAVLERALIDENWKVRAAAAAAVAMADLPELGDDLVRLMNDPIWIVRFEAAQALTQLGELGVARLRQAAAAMRGDASHVAVTTLAAYEAA